MSNCAIDLGNVLTSKTQPFPYVFPDAFEVVSKIVPKFNNTYIISRVNSEQKERAIRWFKEVNFFANTGIDPLNVYFCFDRRDKAIFCKGLNVNYMIDDRADVMRHLPDNIIKLLFQPSKDLEMIGKLKHCYIMNNWKEIGDFFKIS